MSAVPERVSALAAWRLLTAAGVRSTGEAREVVLAAVARQLPRLSAEDIRELLDSRAWPAAYEPVEQRREPDPE